MKELKLENLGSIAVVSPHPDDDVIGLGGLLAKTSRQGIEVDIFYITDGTGAKNFDNIDLRTLRIQEAKRAIELLDLNSLFKLKFYSLSSELVKQDTKTLSIIYQDLEKYDTVFLPHYTDIHPTHRAITGYFTGVLKAKVFYYEVWGTVCLNKDIYYLDISELVELKRDSILAHQSQNRIQPFAQGILSKNKYNAIYSEINNYTAKRYLELFELKEDKGA